MSKFHYLQLDVFAASRGGGNPLGNVDPSGFSYRSISRATTNALRPLTSGKWGYVVPLVPVLGALVSLSIFTQASVQELSWAAASLVVGLGALAVFRRK